MDDAIKSRLQQGDEAALAQFIAAHDKQLLSYIDKQLGDALKRKVEPQDILQEVSIAALKALPQTDFSNLEPFSWLCQIAQQRIVDAHRKYVGAQKRSAKRERSLDGPANPAQSAAFIDLLVASMTSPSQAFSRDQKHMRLADAMATLPEEVRSALKLRYVDGLPTKDIAQKLGKTDVAIRVMLTRSLQKLQQILGAEAG